MGLVFLSINSGIQGTTDSNVETLNNASNADCSDKWSKIDLDIVKIQMDTSTNLLSSSTTFMTFCLLWIGVEVCCGCCCVLAALCNDGACGEISF